MSPSREEVAVLFPWLKKRYTSRRTWVVTPGNIAALSFQSNNAMRKFTKPQVLLLTTNTVLWTIAGTVNDDWWEGAMEILWPIEEANFAESFSI